MKKTISHIDFLNAQRAAEQSISTRCQALDLHCVSALDFLVDGPCGLSMPVLVVTCGKTWAKGAYLAIVATAESEIYWFLDDGECFAHIDTISEHAHLKQWQYPNNGKHHLARFVGIATAAVKHLLGKE